MEATNHSSLSSSPSVCSSSQMSGGRELHITANKCKRAFHEFSPKGLGQNFLSMSCIYWRSRAGRAEFVKNNDRKFLTAQCYTFLKKQHNLVYIQPLTFKLTFSRVKRDQETFANTPSSSLLAVVSPGQRQRLSNSLRPSGSADLFF